MTNFFLDSERKESQKNGYGEEFFVGFFIDYI
jgi:hypothetical protein